MLRSGKEVENSALSSEEPKRCPEEKKEPRPEKKETSDIGEKGEQRQQNNEGKKPFKEEVVSLEQSRELS